MMVIGLVLVGLVAAAVIILRIVDFYRIRAIDSFAATVDFRKITGELDAWVAENPGKNRSHPEAQRIIRECIKKMGKYRNHNLEVDAEKKIAELIKMLN